MYAQLINDKPWPVSALPSSLRYAKEATLNAHGYYAYDVPPKPVINPATHDVYGPTLAFDGASVTATWMVVEKSLEAIKEAKSSEIDAAYAQALSVGVEAMPSDYPGKIFSIQEPSIGRFAVALQKAEAANQATLPLYTLDDELLPAVPVAIAKVGFIACFDAAAALDARYRTLMKSIDTATNAEEVEALEW